MPAVRDEDAEPSTSSVDFEQGPPNILPEDVVSTRRGAVLIRNTILKSDHFPGCQNKKLLPLLEGAPNFRQVPGLPVYGVAIPTTSGLRRVLDAMGAAKGARKVYWHNMREEPVLYVNGRPYVVREADSPFANLEYTGITQTRVEQMEARLKADVLSEAAKYFQHILVAYEGDDFQVIEEWEPTTPVDVQTPLEVYQELLDDGYDIEYVRVPVTDEKAPKDKDCDLLVQRVWDITLDDERKWQQGSNHEHAAIVFNCQMGRGRTTTGMIIASLVLLRKLMKDGSGNTPEWFDLRRSLASPPAGGWDEDSALKAGKFGVIRSLLRVLDQGQLSKTFVDLTIDACSAMQNLREAIATYRGRLVKESNDGKREALLRVVVEYLERYYVLIAFSEYLMDPAFDPSTPSHLTFDTWARQRPELQSILRRMLRRNPLAAINLHRPPDRPDGLRPVSAGGGPEKPSDVAERERLQEDLDSKVTNREGAVLGPSTILKGDHFPGCHSNKLVQLVQGAPNLREVAGMNVWGMAFPTADGLRGAMRHIGVQSTYYTPASNRREAVWINMREEPVLYINGQPYVLREAERPFKNLQEYTGIGAERLVLMEQRLKEDVLREAAQYCGRVLVARESPAAPGSNDSIVNEVYEVIPGPAAVMTAQEMAAALVSEGFCLRYLRLPLTDGIPPRPKDFDVFDEVLAKMDPDAPIVFNCQMGVGRTTTGMVVACMLRHQVQGVPLPQGDLLRSFSEAAHTDSNDGFEGMSPRMAGHSDDEEEDDGSPRSTRMERMDSDDMMQSLPGGSNGIEGYNGAGPGPLSRQRTMIEDHETQQTYRLRNGEYVGVRRFTRSLEYGDEAKELLDKVINACSAVINLRTAIMRYRTPRSRFRFYRPEINARDTAYKRGIAYLERYCLLIAFQAYLAIRDAPGSHVKTFDEWVLQRPDIRRALSSISQNPTGALAPMPLAPPAPVILQQPDRFPLDRMQAERRMHSMTSVLNKRRGGTLSERSILKGYLVPPSKYNTVELPGLHEIRKARHAQVYSVGSCHVSGLRLLFDRLNAGKDGGTHIVISDVREELVVYVNGTAYLRRDLEMPAAAMHHAGIRTYKLEELERRLLADVAAEAQVWDGKLLLHREERQAQRGKQPIAARDVRRGTSEGAEGDHDDVTKQIDQPAPLVAFWEDAGPLGDVDEGLCTARELFNQLAEQGYSLAYRRIPLSRERTPEALDMDSLWGQVKVGSSVPGKDAVHIILARTATGSSCRFAAAFFANVLTPHVQRAPSLLRVDSSLIAEGETTLDKLGALRGEYRAIMNLCRVLPYGFDAKALVDKAIDACEPIGNLRKDVYCCKIISEGSGAEDQAALQHGPEQWQLLEVSAARQQGLHYLQRYFYLIAFRVYLETTEPDATSFAQWFHERAELRHLLSTLSYN